MKTEPAADAPAASSRWAAIATIAATYFYFLIFAEFAFLELAGANAPGADQLRLIMGALGAGGIIGAAGAAFGFRADRARGLLTWTLRACAASGALALAADNVLLTVLAALLTGAALGALTVTVSVMLRGAIGDARLGFGIGAGTGAAYALSNVPWIFHASAAWQTIFAGLAVLLASFLPRFFAHANAAVEASAPARPGNFATVRWIVVLLAFVWLDSAAFYIVQHTPALRNVTWSADATLWTNAGIHLGAALIAGWGLDRQRREWVAAAALVALAGAALILNGALPDWMSANIAYTAGVSLYSVILVEFPARTARPAIAALVFAIAGWTGSALGIGMAQDLASIPTGFVVVAAAVVLAALSLRFRSGARMMIAVLATIGVVRADDRALGREVYIAEGCMHCHSQYIRPRVAADVLNWGPATPLNEALSAAPPLFGTRRQGPDLSHVGNRRSFEWNRLHLIAPQAVSPGSRMPSYAHLFAPDESRGEALLEYLASLGADTFEERSRQIAAWIPSVKEPLAASAAAPLFARLCAHCHGKSGRGDGALAAHLSLRPPDWTSLPWRRVRSSGDVETELSRIIKFGLPGSPMAGHEYLPDDDVVGLARYVRALHDTGGASGLPAAL